jgi:hypothetical protein
VEDDLQLHTAGSGCRPSGGGGSSSSSSSRMHMSHPTSTISNRRPPQPIDHTPSHDLRNLEQEEEVEEAEEAGERMMMLRCSSKCWTSSSSGCCAESLLV